MDEEAALISPSVSGLSAEAPFPMDNRHLTASVMKLLQTAMNEVEHDRATAKMSIARAFSLLRVDAERSAAAGEWRVERGQLVAWQVRRVKAFIEEHLSESIRVEGLSEVARLSAAHFSRAFKRSVGETPHAYIVRRRLTRARLLMLTTEAALCEVALVCGFADQAHFTKLFRNYTGMSPAAWRRERRGMGRLDII